MVVADDEGLQLIELHAAAAGECELFGTNFCRLDLLIDDLHVRAETRGDFCGDVAAVDLSLDASDFAGVCIRCLDDVRGRHRLPWRAGFRCRSPAIPLPPVH